MNKSEIFKAAHKMAKTFVGSYVARFALALRSIYQSLKAKIMKITEQQVTELMDRFNVSYEQTDEGEWDTKFGLVQIISNGKMIWIDNEYKAPRQLVIALKALVK